MTVTWARGSRNLCRERERSRVLAVSGIIGFDGAVYTETERPERWVLNWLT